MRTLKEDLQFPLDEVERKWLRRTALVMLTPPILIVGAFAGIVDIFVVMYRDCW